MTEKMGLDALEARVQKDLACLNWGAPDWVRPREHPDGHVYDVVIVGGGQSGLGAAFGLMRERVRNLLVIDECPEGYEGPWDTYARMRTLRTPKHLTSIDLGVPSLTFRAWWEARLGEAAWEALDKIPRGDWMDYLRWYRKVLDLPVRNETRLVRLEPLDGLYRLHLASGAPLLARKVVLATGIQGGGEWHVPDFVKASLPADRYSHTADPIDYADWAGKKIAILGSGASAFDNADAAFEKGVGEVHVFARREKLPTVNPIRFMEAEGFIPRYPMLDDASKYRVMASFFERSQPPTNDMLSRALAQPGFQLHLGAGWDRVEPTERGARVHTPKGSFDFDHLVLSTGTLTDPKLREELSDIADAIKCWRDVEFDGPRHSVIDGHCYTTNDFGLVPRDPEDAGQLRGLFAFSYAAFVSLGLSAAALSGLKHALPRLVNGVLDQLFADDQAAILERYLAYDEPELVVTGYGETTP